MPQAIQCHAPYHPKEMTGMFSNITVAFLPRNTTSRTQCLDAGVIKNWKVKFRRKLLRCVCSKIGHAKKASDVVKSVNLQAIRWMQQALDEVDPNTIVRCWCKVGVHLSGEECNDADDPFAGEELLALDRLIYQVQDPTDEPDGIPPKEYINDDNVPCVQPLIDVDNNEWRKEVRNELLENFRAESNESVCERDEDPFAVDHRDDKFDLPLREPKFK